MCEAPTFSISGPLQLRVWNGGTGGIKLVTLACTRRYAEQQAEQLSGRVRSAGEAQARLSMEEACPACEPASTSSAERSGSGSGSGSSSGLGAGSQVSAALSSEEESWAPPQPWSLDE